MSEDLVVPGGVLPLWTVGGDPGDSGMLGGLGSPDHHAPSYHAQITLSMPRIAQKYVCLKGETRIKQNLK